MLHMNGQEVSEERIFECYGNIHVYCLVVGADEPLGSIFFIVIDFVLLPISCKIFPLTVFLHRQPMFKIFEGFLPYMGMAAMLVM